MLKRFNASFKADNRYILPDGKSGCMGLNHDSEYSGLLSVGLLCNGCPQPLPLKLRYSGVSECQSMFFLAFRTRTPR
jgi:hypothetical protein